jgi:hypothetical protein
VIIKVGVLFCFLFQFLGELSLIDADPYLKYLPSLIAGAAFHLALYTVTGQSWVCITSCLLQYGCRFDLG